MNRTRVLIATAGLGLVLGLGSLASGRGFLGIHPGEDEVDLSDRGFEGSGVLVVRVLRETPAEEAGLQAGDILLRVGERRVEDGDDLTWALGKHAAGDKVTLTVWRDGKEQPIGITLGDPKEAEGESVSWNTMSRSGHDEDQGFLGVVVLEPAEEVLKAWNVKEGYGVLINELVDDSPAQAAGLKEGDVLVELDGSPVYNASRLGKLCRRQDPGTMVTLSVIRQGKPLEIKATLGKHPGTGWFGENGSPVDGSTSDFGYLRDLEQLRSLQSLDGSFPLVAPLPPSVYGLDELWSSPESLEDRAQ